MSNSEPFQASSSDNPGLEKLIRRFREAEADLKSVLDGQVDAVLDPVTAIPILLQETQAYLRASDARYRRLLSRNVVVVFELEADGTTLFVNEAVFDMLGYTSQELLGRKWWDILLPGDQHQQLDDLYRQFQAGDVTQYELMLTTKQGSMVIIELNTVNRRKPDATLDRILGLVLNITERRQVENELREKHAYFQHLSAERIAELSKANFALQQLADLRQQLLLIEQAALIESEQANRMKVQFLATVSHELRTPLTAIKGFATTLLDPDVSFDAETQHDFIAIVNEEADRLNDLIEQLLDGARLQAGTLRIQPEPSILSAIIDIAMAQLKSVTVQHQLSIKVSPELAPIMADAQRIAQVLVNLIDNAVKFSLPGTRITLSAVQHDTTIQVDVADEGPGIAVENRDKVFENFWQPKKTTSQSVKGLGLGLAICKGIITAHGGSIWVAEVSSGTTISFTLPRVPS